MLPDKIVFVVVHAHAYVPHLSRHEEEDIRSSGQKFNVVVAQDCLDAGHCRRQQATDDPLIA